MRRVFTLIVVFLAYSLVFIFKFPFPLPYCIFFLGCSVGYGFHIIDRIVQLALIPEFEKQRKDFLYDVSHVQFSKALTFLLNAVEPASSSSIFILIYFPLAIYVITSTGSLLGLGLMLGLGFSYTIHLLLNFNDLSKLKTSYFSLLKQTVSVADMKKLTIGFIALFGVLSCFVLLS